MVRTKSWQRQADAADITELVDRTGILAASIPPQRRRVGPADAPTEELPATRPVRGIGRSGVVAWAAGALVLVAVLGGLYGMNRQGGVPMEAAGGLADGAVPHAPAVEVPSPAAAVEPRPAEPVARERAAEPKPVVAPTAHPEAGKADPQPRIDRPAAEPKDLREQVRQQVEPALEAADAALREVDDALRAVPMLAGP
ncbi:hypothetical protein SAMN05421810_107168 [Amycolatopsis arida]|uniref:Uncharacterized protein n=1 Tax=Amycolatopsis arida TaxID=587909 RepID=A0A1I5YHS3_9PSEU|nr:hypothetical protein [Amycolatopsis arida]TDX90522.1 hypothetical protein CLV69_107168 [Amycolatopsis arida]SFQ43700.1 hypothetical protein SAMN05421810_107168 [Amycolatopsis arida]